MPSRLFDHDDVDIQMANLDFGAGAAGRGQGLHQDLDGVTELQPASRVETEFAVEAGTWRN